MASLTLKHVDRAFPNGYEAVKDLNFQIEDGEFVILTGPSGSGKSAVMRMIAGLDEVKNGGKCECPLYYTACFRFTLLIFNVTILLYN